MTGDPLADLVIDRSALARDELAHAIEPYIRLTADGNVVFEPAFDALSAVRKVACVLLAFRAANILGIRERPGGSPQEIIDASGMAPGTVRPKLSELAKARLATKEGREYLVPHHAMRRIADVLRTETD